VGWLFFGVMVPLLINGVCAMDPKNEAWEMSNQKRLSDSFSTTAVCGSPLTEELSDDEESGDGFSTSAVCGGSLTGNLSDDDGYSNNELIDDDESSNDAKEINDELSEGGKK
jgi:hypothetical protein